MAPEGSPNLGVLPSNGDLLQTLAAQNSLLMQTLLQQAPSQRTDLGILSGSGGGSGGGQGGA